MYHLPNNFRFNQLKINQKNIFQMANLLHVLTKWHLCIRALVFALLPVFLLITVNSAFALPPVNETYNPTPNIEIQKPILVVGSEQDFPPFATGMTDETAGGFTVELWKAVAAEAGLNYNIRVRPFHELLQEFKAGKIDVLINLASSEQRHEFADFTVPHMIVHGAIFVRKGQTNISSENDFTGKSIIVLSGDLAHDYAISKGLGKQLVLANTAEEGLRMLASGNHDAMLISKLAGMQTMQSAKLRNIDVLEAKAGFSQKFSFAVHKGQADLLHKINEGLAVTKTNGAYNTIYEKWFGIYEVKEITLFDFIKYLTPMLVIFIGILAYSLRLTRHESEDRKALFVMNPNATVVIDNNGIVSNINPAFSRMFHVNESILIGLTELELDCFIQEKCTGDDQYIATSSLPINAELKSKQTVASINNHELSFTIECGGIKVIARSYVDCNISRISRIIHFQDITERSIVDRMKSEFIATAAHELRTPMTTIFGFIEILKDIPLDVETQKEMISTVHVQAKLMINLLNEVLDMAKMEAQAANLYHMDHQPIGPILEALTETFIPPDNRKKVALEISPHLPEVNIDKAKIEQAIKNALSNAYKFSPKDDEIKMQVTEVLHKDESKILISIQDRGIGMTSDELKRIYEKFYRADQSGNIPGTGLGMAIMKDIIDYHGGEIVINSEYGVGTTINIYLPVITSN
jgi:signal transduction histidine kinase/ABC-type amino acid transport substrate-binding protein